MQCWLMNGLVVLLLCGCGGSGVVGNAAGNAPANSATKGASQSDATSDEGRAEALVREFMKASEAQDQEKCRSMLVKAEREKQDGSTMSFNKDGNLKSWSIGKVSKDGDEIIVPVDAVMADKPEPSTMPMVVVKEGAEFRISLEKTFTRYFRAMSEKRKANGGG